MVRFALFLLAASSLYGEYSVEMLSGYKKTLQDRVEQNKTVTTESKYSDNIIVLRGNFEGKRSNMEYKIQFLLNKRLNDKDYKDILYLGNNCYLLLPIQKIHFVMGRSLFSESPYLKTSWKDGMEGFGLKAQISENFQMHVYLVDFYRSFPLFEKYFFYKNLSDVTTNGERFRHGLTVIYQKDTLYSKFHFTYLNFGNWGNSTRDDLKAQPKGDSDFLYNITMNVSEKINYFTGGFEIQLARGIDKVQYNPARKEKSIPISGELIRVYFESYFKMFRFKLDLFLPDSDKRNAQGEILETGFIGQGTYPFNAFILNQELNFYPSGWVTPIGLQKANSIYNGRKNSFWLHGELSLHLEDLFFILEADHLTPRISSGTSSGGISFQRKDYERNFLLETTASILYDKRKEGFFIRLNVSKLTTSKEIGLDGTSAFLQGGIVF